MTKTEIEYMKRSYNLAIRMGYLHTVQDVHIFVFIKEIYSAQVDEIKVSGQTPIFFQ